MTTESTDKNTNWLGRSLRWAWRFVVRLVLVLLAGGIIGAAAYFFGVPLLFREPFQKIDDTAAIIQVQTTQQATTAQQLGERLSSLQERIVNLEVFRDATNDSGNQLQSRFEDIESAQATQQALTAETLQSMQDSLDEIGAAIEALELSLSEVEAQVVNVQATAGTQNSDLEAALATQRAELSALQELVEARGTPLENLARELQVVRVMASITRAAVFIEQANFGLAEDEVTTALEILTRLTGEAPENQAVVLGEVLDNLEAVAVALPEDPALAISRLEFAWQLLTRELSNLTSGSPQELTPTTAPGESTPAPTSTPVPPQ